MKTLNRTIVITVTSIVIGCLTGLFLLGRFYFWNFKHMLGLVSNRVQYYSEAFTIALLVFTLAWIIKHTINNIGTTHKQFYDLFENNPTPMAIVDKQTQRFLAVNKASIKFYGYTAHEFQTMTTADIWVENDRLMDPGASSTTDCLPNQTRTIKHLKKDGEVILTEVSCTEVIFKNKNCRMFLARDISEILRAKEDKRIAEEENMNQKKFTSYVLENFPVDVAIFNKDHRYIFINKIAVKNEEMRKWMIGKDDFEYFAKKGLDTSIAGMRRERFLKAVAGESTEWIDEHCVNGEKRYILRKFYPYYEGAELKYVYGYGMDITEIKQAQVQKDAYMSQLEKITFTTSHKIRQPICNIQGLISLLEDENFDIKDLRSIISCLSSSSKVLDDLTRDLAIKLHEYKRLLSSNEEPV